MYRNILVPLDGSHFAEHAVPMAAAVARSHGGKICLLQVMPPLSDRYFWAPEPGSDLDIDLHARYREEASTYLEKTIGQIRGLTVRYKLLDEHINVPEAIETEIAEDGIDLVVMASHGRTALDRFWLGSVTDNLYRTASVPVLVTRPKPTAVDFGREPPLRRVLVALDGSPRAEQILDTVITLGHPPVEEVVVVRVVPEEENARKAETYLETVAARVRLSGTAAETRTYISGDPAAAILRAAEGVDLIAMQTRGERGMSRLFHGSVVANVIHDTRIPVLIGRPRN